MKAYPTVSLITQVVRVSFKAVLFTLLLSTASIFGYAQALADAAQRECYSPLQPASDAPATKVKSAQLKAISCKEPTAAHPLPVKLSAFNAARKSDVKVSLEWTTQEEINASHFVVERSFDGKEFDEAALVFAYGESKEEKIYRFTDMPGKKKVSAVYYRLRIVDMDGKTERSSVRAIGTTD